MSHFSQAFTFIEVIDRLRDPEPAHRYETAAAVEAALRRWPEQPTPAGPHHRARYATALAAGAAVLTAVIVAGVGYRSGPATPEARRDPAPFALKAGDWILVSEFENQTGESVLDGTIRAAVERDLEYSDHVRAAQRDRIEDALKLLQRPLDSALNTSLALQLSQRDGGIRAVVSGSIDRADDGYRLTFDVFDAANQTPLTRLSDHAPGHSDILPAVRRQTLRLREILGEPAASIERSHETFQRARLPSLNALNLASQGRAIINLRPMSPLSEWMRMEKFARAAVQEDAAFPEGHLLLAWALTHGGRRDEGLAHAERAFLLADSATPQERYAITASFHTLRVRMGQLRQRRERELSMAERQEIEKATAALEALFALQPDHYALGNNLRTAYRLLGRERDIAWMNLRHADVRPWSVDVNFEVANQLLREGNVDGARRYAAHAASAVSAGASTADPDLAASVRLFHAYVAWVQDDPDQTLRALNEVAASAGKLTDGDRRQLYLRLSPMYAALGRLRDAARAIEKIGPAARDDVVNATMVDIARAQLLADRGDLIGLRELAGTQWHDPLPTNAPPRLAFRVPFLIEAGLLDAAERDLEWFKRRTADASEWAPRAPTASIGPFYAANAGSLELARGRPAAAAVILRQAMPGGRSGPPAMFSPGGPQGQYAAMRLAAALEAVGNIPEAIATLEQAVADRVAVTIGNTPNRWLRTNAYLARLHRRNKQEAKARTIEAQLLKLLSEADADHPLVVELGRRGSETREHQGSWAGYARARQ